MIALTMALMFAMQSEQAQNVQTASNERAPTVRAMDDPERVICRRERVVGTNRPQRVCMTAREWEVVRDASRETMNRSERGQVQSLPSQR